MNKSPKYYSIISLLLLLLFVATPCQSKQSYVFNLSQDYGGEALAIDSNNQIQLGAGLNTTLGVLSSTENSNINYLLSLGYKINAANFPGGAVLFTTYPLNALVYYSQPLFTVGIGIAHHLSPTYRHTCSVRSQCGESRNYKFNSSVGVVFDYQYYLSAKSFLGVRYTSMKYSGVNLENRSNGNISNTLDVSSIGIQLGYEF